MLIEKRNIPDWEIMFYTLLESAEKNDWVDIDDNLSVRMYPWDCGELYNREAGELFESPYVMCCEDDEEFTAEAASHLLRSYEEWMSKQSEPVETIDEIHRWEQAEPFVMDLTRQEEIVYSNCCDYLYYGDSFHMLIENDHHYGMDLERVRELWRLAFWFMAEGCMTEDPYTTRETCCYVAA